MKTYLGSEWNSTEDGRISSRQMKNILENLKNNSNKSSTKMTYLKVWQNFNKFVIKLDEIPTTWEERLSLYCAYLIQIKNRQSSTIRSYISAIKKVLTTDGYQWDDQLIIFSTITKTCKLHFDTIKPRFPIRHRFLEVILFETQRKFALMNQPFLEILYVTAYLLLYFGMMRVGEVAAGDHSILARNVHYSENRKEILIMLYTSKTHNESDEPQRIRIKQNQLEVLSKKKCDEISKQCINKNFCPIKWFNRYRKVRGGYITKSEQFFIFSDGSPLTARHLRTTLRQIILKLGLNEKLYDVHSFRIGRATDLFRQGISIEKIKDLGRWKSNAVYKYLKNY